MALKTYTITKENRVTNSPFYIEGSDMKFDVTHQFPLPTETITVDKEGRQKVIRFIAGCDTIDKSEQVKRGYPEKRKATATERMMLTFLGGMLSVPDGYSNLENYLDEAPWFVEPDAESESKKIRPPHSRKVYELYDQEKIDDDNLDFETMVTEARTAIINADRNTLVSLLRLSRQGGVVDANINMKQVKLQMLELANNNPDFILKNITTVKNDATVLVSKAIDYGILNVDTPGKLMIKKKVGENYEEVTKIADFGGRGAKIDRVVAFFEGDLGKLIFGEVKNRISQFEASKGLAEEAPTTTTTTQAATTTTTTESQTTTTTTQSSSRGNRGNS
jgi:hypothetical protein